MFEEAERCGKSRIRLRLLSPKACFPCVEFDGGGVLTELMADGVVVLELQNVMGSPPA